MRSSYASINSGGISRQQRCRSRRNARRISGLRMEKMDVDGEERRKEKKKHKKSKKSSRTAPEADAAHDSGDEAARRERKKERKRSKRRQRDSGEQGAEEGEVRHSPSWTATGATLPSPAEELTSVAALINSQPSPRKPNEQPEVEKEPGEVESSGGGGAAEELSIEETNKLRAALGLKPLQVSGSKPAETATKKEDVHAPAGNIAHDRQAQKIKERLETVKNKHAVEKKLRHVKGLGEASDDEETAESWVERNRRIVEARRQAELQAEMQRRADAEQQEEDEEPTNNLPYYSARELKGLKVEHDLDRFQEGSDIVLTLKDAGVLEDGSDVLVSTALTEQEKLERNLENKKKKAAYNPYEDADALQRPGLLKKYDEVIDGDRKGQFTLETGGTAPGAVDAARRDLAVGTPFRPEMLQTLLTNERTLARDFFNEQEMAGKFKKVKKSSKNRRQQSVKDEPLPVMKPDPGTVPDEEDDVELQLALSRARRLRQQQQSTSGEDLLEAHLAAAKETAARPPEGWYGGAQRVFLDETSEFCRRVGTELSAVRAGKEEPGEGPPEYGGGFAGFGEAGEEEMEVEEDEGERERGAPVERKGGWSEVQFEAEPANLGSDQEEEEERRKKRRSRPNSSRSNLTRSILDDEPTAGRGIGTTLELAMKKGLIEDVAEAKKAAALKSLRGKKKSSVPQQQYTVEDKNFEDDKRTRHNERYAGPLVNFKDKAEYIPSFKLEYHDSAGRQLDAKAAFRDLSHKFHGKASGKMKTEKRAKKFQEDKLLQEMSSVDTPLGTVAKMKRKQEEQQTPYLILSGAHQTKAQHLHPTPLSKKS
ncbi:U4/U6.U5 tri-snRNP-associated protein 1-like [Paramacrobiotus metropolitanus]|uniref:U4/U6.U5 tri-snRNP-associated protein 1-like n=1 Tax=Paramacrobiotus metropolitanus TaxID=2943436 RepID=UPI0024457F5A|nr:U4/U6.U5 tri-snRNP-associated protein 1-like [Paramacrobiotus metropolitanus]